jgi:predicted secreted protein
MKKIILASAAALLFASAAIAQNVKPSNTSAKEAKKAVTLSGTVSSDSAILLADRDHKAWKVANPEALAENAGQHVQVSARIESSNKEIFVTSVKVLEDGVLSAKWDDAAFRR